MTFHPPLFVGQVIPASYLNKRLLSLKEDESLCTIVLPRGVQVQLFYENFTLTRVFLMDGSDRDVPVTQCSLPRHLECDYLQSTTSGDFDICGRLWITQTQLHVINARQTMGHQSPYTTPEAAIMALLVGPPQWHMALCFTPNWSYTLFEQGVFATYTEFIDALCGDFELEPAHEIPMANRAEIVAIYAAAHGYQDDLLHISGALAEALVILRNHLPARGHDPMITPADLLVAQVPFGRDTIEGIIDDISLEADRFGWLRPRVTLISTETEDEDPIDTLLPDIAYLKERQYRVGDRLSMTRIAHLTILGDILDNAQQPHIPLTTPKTCPCCTTPLVSDAHRMRCPNPSCLNVLYRRLCYACHEHVLDLPLDQSGLLWWFYDQSDQYPIPTARRVIDLLNLERTALEIYFPDDEVEHILSTLHQRRKQLRGETAWHGVQRIARGRLLDALSIPGLYPRHIHHILTYLDTHRRAWSDLADVLTDGGVLLKIGIPKAEGRSISMDALRRYDELKEVGRL